MSHITKTDLIAETLEQYGDRPVGVLFQDMLKPLFRQAVSPDDLEHGAAVLFAHLRREFDLALVQASRSFSDEARRLTDARNQAALTRVDPDEIPF